MSESRPDGPSDPAWIDLAAERFGGRVIAANDEFFAEKENLLRPTTPVFDPERYTDRGKWMDGWETRRRRTPGHDWCVARLGAPGHVREAVVDTTHFRGNHPEACSLEGVAREVGGGADPVTGPVPEVGWFELLGRSPLAGDTANRFRVDADRAVTQVRLNIFPDGGVARLRLYGEVASTEPPPACDLAALSRGAVPLASSDAFFGAPHQLLMPGEAEHMGEGWETRRRRGPGHDWMVIRLAYPGQIDRVEIDTRHFKGNFPESAWLEAARLEDPPAPDALGEPDWDAAAWTEILGRQPLAADRVHTFDELAAHASVTHVRFHIHRDGGVARLRLWGRPTDPA